LSPVSTTRKTNEMEKCKFCGGTGNSRFFDFEKCHNVCPNIENCNKGFNCEVAGGIDLCPDCNGLGYIVKGELIMQN
jgi:ssDNA-binding Zn-finger/Zn-ribbon topoisomerase 1